MDVYEYMGGKCCCSYWIYARAAVHIFLFSFQTTSPIFQPGKLVGIYIYEWKIPMLLLAAELLMNILVIFTLETWFSYFCSCKLWYDARLLVFQSSEKNFLTVHHHRLFSVFDQDQPSAMLINSIWPWRIAPNWRRCIFWIAHGMISPVPNNIWSDFFSAGYNVVQEQYTIYVGGVFQLVLLSLLILRSATIRWGMSCRENLLSTLGSDYCHSNYSWIQSQFFSNAACSP